MSYFSKCTNVIISEKCTVNDLFGNVTFYTIFYNIKNVRQLSFLDLVQKNLLKTCQSVRQLYGDSTDVDSKIRE